MENLNVNFAENNKTSYQTRLLAGDNNELIFIKKYIGDWGDWDECPTYSTDKISFSDENEDIQSA